MVQDLYNIILWSVRPKSAQKERRMRNGIVLSVILISFTRYPFAINSCLLYILTVIDVYILINDL